MSDPLSRTSPPRGQTRAALMQAALEMVASESNFSALSLRRVTRQAGVVPTAFYRHFRDMDDLGITLVDETFAELRAVLAAVDLPSLSIDGLIHHCIGLFAFHVCERRLLFQFLVRERYAGSAALRDAIQTNLAALNGQLTHDLSQLDAYSAVDNADLALVADLVVNIVIATAERILDVARADAPVDTVVSDAERQLQLIFLGLSQWPTSRPQTSYSAGAGAG